MTKSGYFLDLNDQGKGDSKVKVIFCYVHRKMFLYAGICKYKTVPQLKQVISKYDKMCVFKAFMLLRSESFRNSGHIVIFSWKDVASIESKYSRNRNSN